MTDPSWREFFRSLSDEALLTQVARGLNPAARAQAEEVLRQRGLALPPAPPPGAAAPGDGDDWVELARDLSPTEAHVLTGCLQAAGIPADAGDVQIVGLNPLWSLAVGGAKVRVPESQQPQARAVLEAMQRGELSIDEDHDVGEAPPESKI